MKELKHLMYFERLLDDAHNELVRQAEAEGDLAIGYTCFHAPEVLLNLGSCFSVRLRAPHTTSMELATYYMANNSCEFSRAILERALEGNYGFLHAMAGVDVREANNRALENMEIMHAQGADKDKFFYCNLDIPYSDDEDCVEHICEQVSRKILKPMRENYGVDTSDAAIRAAVSEHNEVCRILTEIGVEAESREVDYAVVGIGINCARVDLPPEVSAMSASLEAFTGQKPDRARLAAALVRSLCELEQALFTEKDAWLREFAAHCITIGQDVKLVRGDDVTYAHAAGIDEEAALLVTYPDGTKAAVASGEVSVRGMYGYA